MKEQRLIVKGPSLKNVIEKSLKDKEQSLKKETVLNNNKIQITKENIPSLQMTTDKHHIRNKLVEEFFSSNNLLMSIIHMNKDNQFFKLKSFRIISLKAIMEC